jgi:hypothetical protein
MLVVQCTIAPPVVRCTIFNLTGNSQLEVEVVAPHSVVVAQAVIGLSPPLVRKRRTA